MKTEEQFRREVTEDFVATYGAILKAAQMWSNGYTNEEIFLIATAVIECSVTKNAYERLPDEKRHCVKWDDAEQKTTWYGEYVDIINLMDEKELRALRAWVKNDVGKGRI